MHCKLFYCSAWKGLSKTWLRAVVMAEKAKAAKQGFREAFGLVGRRGSVVVRRVTDWEKERWIQDPESAPPIVRCGRVARGDDE